MPYRTRIEQEHYAMLGLTTLQARRNFALSCFAFKMCRGLSPAALDQYRPTVKVLPYSVRRAGYVLPDGSLPSSALLQRSSLTLATKILNLLDPDCVTQHRTMDAFKEYLVGKLRDEQVEGRTAVDVLPHCCDKCTSSRGSVLGQEAAEAGEEGQLCEWESLGCMLNRLKVITDTYSHPLHSVLAVQRSNSELQNSLKTSFVPTAIRYITLQNWDFMHTNFMRTDLTCVQ
ncbi:hypothetical protein WMY93_018021 [Mugilogobius chulae]|uniref:Uncharacterized protein n=1 Tax=Mugilogobius chulae TaxID=88201 RepID=A0AAW0NTL7_9GOBI